MLAKKDLQKMFLCFRCSVCILGFHASISRLNIASWEEGLEIPLQNIAKGTVMHRSWEHSTFPKW